MKQENIQWHPAFVGAIQLELAEYRDSIEFIPEFQLTTEPLRIDCVVIKKPKGLVIKKNIAAMFREVNLLEYKSPGHNVSIADFYKVYAYACLYAGLKKTPITSLTMTFIESRFPRELFIHLKNCRGYLVEETGQGIYTVKGDILPIQVIDSRKLPANENLWLKSLRKCLGPLELLQLSDAGFKEDEALVNPYFHAIVHANPNAIEEAKKMSSAAKTLDEVLERTGLIAEWEERQSLKIARNMVNSGFPIETVISMTELEPEKVKALFEDKLKPK